MNNTRINEDNNLETWCIENDMEYLLSEWDCSKNCNIRPNQISYGSEKRVWWKCSHGHEWETFLYSRTKEKTGCPFCSGRRPVRGENDLQTTFPDVAREWDYCKNGDLLPSDVKKFSNQKVWWLCANQHSYKSKISNRTIKGEGCPYCSGHRTLEGYNDLKTWCINNEREDLLKEWNYKKNTISPSQVSPANSKKVWWRCSLGHDWDSTIGSRTSKKRPSGCPYCSNPPKKILVGFNDFASWCHRNGKDELLAEWNVDRNGTLSPQQVTFGSGKQVWWKCARGHEWIVSLSNRVQGTGCPVCSRTQTSFPEQAIAFFLAKSFCVLQRYSVKGYEIDVFLEEYKIGIEYDGMHYHTHSSEQREQEKDLFFCNQGIEIIHVKENREIELVESDTVYYIPRKTNYLDESFNRMIGMLLDLLEKKTGVRVKKDFDVVRDELAIRKHYASIVKSNSFASVFPELVPEWDVERNNGMTPDSFSAFSQTRVWWKCRKGHSWRALISTRFRLGCPYCSGQRTIQGENDLVTWSKNNTKILLEEWDYDRNEQQPEFYQKTSNKVVWWKCEKGHKWRASIANRIHGTGCPECNKGDSVKRRSITLRMWCEMNNQDNLLKEWNYDKNDDRTPDNCSFGSHLKVWWKCSEGHEWEAVIKSRTYNHGCPYCSRTYKKVLLGQNDLVTWCNNSEKQYILREWDYNLNDGLKPEMFTFGSHKRISWKCCKGHTWSAVIKDRTKVQGNMCPECRKGMI